MSVLQNVFQLACFLGLILANGFFVAAEFAIVTVRSTQLEPLIRDGVRRAKLAHHLVTHLDMYLSATQLGITFSSLGLGWLGEPFVSRLITGLFALVGIEAVPWVASVITIIGFVLVTFFLIVFGELAPRFLAIRFSDKFTLSIARPLHVFYLVFRPFIRLLNRSAAVILQLVGITPAREAQLAHSEEELRILVSRGLKTSPLGRAISLNALELRSRSIREIMVPRTSVVFLSTTKSLEDNIALAIENQYTRYPLCEKDLDHILGMVHLQELFRLKGESGSGERLVEVKRDIPSVPETMNLERLLNVFLTKRSLMAVVVDEYGGTAGLITLQNVLEELVGDIRDEFDSDQPEVRKIADGEYIIDAAMSLHDFSRMFDVQPLSGDVVTVSGFVIQLLGRVPEKGATFGFGRWAGVVESMDRKRVKSLRLKAVQPANAVPQEQKS